MFLKSDSKSGVKIVWIICSTVTAMLNDGSQMGGFVLVMQLHLGGSSTNRATPSSFYMLTPNPGLKIVNNNIEHASICLIFQRIAPWPILS